MGKEPPLRQCVGHHREAPAAVLFAEQSRPTIVRVLDARLVAERIDPVLDAERAAANWPRFHEAMAASACAATSSLYCCCALGRNCAGGRDVAAPLPPTPGVILSANPSRCCCRAATGEAVVIGVELAAALAVGVGGETACSASEAVGGAAAVVGAVSAAATISGALAVARGGLVSSAGVTAANDRAMDELL